jgi:hypothetical protein
MASHRFVVAASTVSAAVAIGIAVVVSELLRREFAKLQQEDTQKSAAHALHHVDVSSSASFSRGLERQNTEELLDAPAATDGRMRARRVSKDSLVPGFRGEDSTFRSVNPASSSSTTRRRPHMRRCCDAQTLILRLGATRRPARRRLWGAPRKLGTCMHPRWRARRRTSLERRRPR